MRFTLPTLWLLLLFFNIMPLYLIGQVSISGIVNDYTPVTGITQPACAACDPSCIHTITVADASAFSVGDKALIIQMKGATINTANAAGSGNVTAINNAGNYEFFEIGSIVGNVLTPRFPLIRSYTITGVVQVVRVPQYDDVNIAGTLTGLDWNDAAGIGGVVAIDARKVTFNANIEMSGRGYEGIQMPINGTPDNCSIDPATQLVLPFTDNSSYIKGDGIVIDNTATNRGRAPRANGGGAGVSGDSGGGGGSNFGAGGEGGKRWCDVSGANAGGIGGFSLTPFLAQDKVFLGGAGGPGWVSTGNPSTAADGGGIVIIFADTIVGNGFSINNNGLSPVSVNPVGAPDGGGGGGAGGTTVLKSDTYIGNLTVNAAGGQGQDLNTNIYHGPGGGGGGGVLLYSLAALPANVILNVTPGQGGQHNDGFRNDSRDGQAGGSISLYIPIQNPNYEGNVDTDLISTSCDVDDDNDGVPDIQEIYVGDHDGDGIPDFSDPDFCLAVFQGVNGWDCAANRLPDPSGDMDGDGRPNFADPDFPYCGGLNANGTCRNMDTDGDGAPNHLDLDADNDGIPDIIEAGGTDTNGDGFADNNADIDGDGLVDIYDNNNTDGPLSGTACSVLPSCLQTASTSSLFDTNNDGIIDRFPDADNDGIPNYLDLDSDNDGIADVVEAGGTDANGDGRADNFIDNDNDGYNDVLDAAIEVCTFSSNNITVTGNGVSVSTNTGIINPNNAIANPDGTVAELADDTDVLGLDFGQSIPSGAVVNIHWRATTNGNAANLGVRISLVNPGVYSNQTPTPLSTASATIGTSTITTTVASRFIEIFDAGADGFQIDAISWSFSKTLTTKSCVTNAGTPLIVTGADTNGDGVPNSYPTDDFDGDRILNFLDLDSDNDGVADVVETAGLDADNNGIADNYVDTDGDGFNDNVDGDVGNDGVAENTANAQVRTGNDANGDGRPDNYPTDDADRDGHLNFLDLDADNDGITDVVENNSGLPTTGATSDAPTGGSFDGFIGDGTITDGNNNGWHDAAEGARPLDSDGDGILDIYDIDADNDGIADYVEATCSTCPTFSINVPTGTDSNNNGVLDQFEALNNANGVGGVNVGLNPNEDDNDGTGPADYLDTDTDNDGGMDWAEGFDNGFGGATAGDGNAALEIINMANHFVTQYELIFGISCACYPNIDSDNDGLPAWLDSDDNVVGYNRATQPPFLNPASIYWRDEDNDGLADIFDQLIFTTSVGSFSTVPDADNINDRDWRDVASIITFPVQLIVFDAHRITYNDVKLNWATATELNNQGFDVERMLSNETEFTKIGFVQGAGTTTNITTYEYHDANSHSSTSYYRLRQVDADGNSVYSVIRAVEGQDEAQKATILLYPNPAKNYVNIRFGDIQANTAVTVRLIDMKGVALQNHESRVSTFDIFTLDIQNLVPASYVLDIQFANGEKTVLKFVKQQQYIAYSH